MKARKSWQKRSRVAGVNLAKCALTERNEAMTKGFEDGRYGKEAAFVRQHKQEPNLLAHRCRKALGLTRRTQQAAV